MAFLQETPKSVRAYFILVGTISILSNLAALLQDNQRTVVMGLAALGLVVAGGFFYCGLRMYSLLKEAPQQIGVVLFASIGLSAIFLALLISYGANAGDLVWSVITIAIDVYLIRQVRRLARTELS